MQLARPRVSWLAASALLIGCQAAPSDPAGADRAAPLVVAGAAAAPAAGPSAPGAATRAYDALAYDLRAHYDWSAQKLIAVEDITLALADAQHALVELDSAVEIDRVHAHGRTLPFTVDSAAQTVAIDLSPLHPRRAPVTFTVEYRAGTSTGFAARAPRDGDPNRARVVYTDSEPDRGALWLVANHHPADRAHWSVEITVAADEDVVANGNRVEDRRCDGQRVVRYEMPQPLPTYLMAFAAGQLEHRERRHGRLPIGLWYRRGLAVDVEHNLDQIEDAMTSFEKLLGPYPFERYSEVMLPDFPGGMENATITFNEESAMLNQTDFSLSAHELSHHWFGDWVTMHDFADAWIKEGMATVLEVEADRARRDSAGSGRLFGHDFTFNPGDAIVDDSLHGVARYTSGLYQRAAWIITQIRATVGEAAFWKSLRGVLRDHALDSIDGPSFIRAFAPALPQAQIDQLIATLPQKAVPAVALAVTQVGMSTEVTMTLSDPAASIIAPPGIAVVDADGNVAPTASLQPGVPLTVSVPYGGYLASDEADVHPGWEYSFNADSDTFWTYVTPLYLPSAPAALTTLLARSPAMQERALDDDYEWSATAFAALWAGLDSTWARQELGSNGCWPLYYGLDPAWGPLLGSLMQEPAADWLQPSLGHCGSAFATQYFAAQLAQAIANPDVHSAPRLEYLLSFDYGPSAALASIGAVASSAPTLALRELALARLSDEILRPAEGYTPLTPADVPAWQAFFRARLAESTSARHFDLTFNPEAALADVAALPIVAAKLHAVAINPARQRQVVCSAFAMSTGNSDAWTAFAAAAQPWSTLAPGAQAVLANPSGCTLTPAGLVAQGQSRAQQQGARSFFCDGAAPTARAGSGGSAVQAPPNDCEPDPVIVRTPVGQSGFFCGDGADNVRGTPPSGCTSPPSGALASFFCDDHGNKDNLLGTSAPQDGCTSVPPGVALVGADQLPVAVNAVGLPVERPDAHVGTRRLPARRPAVAPQR